MRLASAVAAQQERFIAQHVACLREALVAGHSLLYTFDREDATFTRLDVMGPRGLRCSGAANDGEFLAAPVPTIRLWSPSSHQRPVAVASSDRNFGPSLDVLAERAKPLVGDELAVLLALLATVRDHAPRLRPRVPKVPLTFTSSGMPSMDAWASCLGLGDLEDAFVVRAVA